MLTGISTACLYPANTEASLGAVCALGPACAEVFINSGQELEPSYLRGLRTVADSFGVAVVSVHPYMSVMEPLLFFSEYERRFDEGMELYRRFYQAAGILGAGALVFHGNSWKSRLGREQYFERFGRLWEDARRHGVSLCQENVERCASRSVQFLEAMTKALPQAEYILDVKQAVRAGQDACEMAEILGGRIKHIHISDHNETESCLAPGRGVFNIARLLDISAKNGFDGGVIVELYRDNFGDIVELSGGYQHVSHIVSTFSNNA